MLKPFGSECSRVQGATNVAFKLGIALPFFSLSALSRLGLCLADDFKGKPPHWLLGINSVWVEILVGAKGKHFPEELWRWLAKIVTTII
jgi:hypothetical protein